MNLKFHPNSSPSSEKIGLVLYRVIPAKAGIQCFHWIRNTLDPCFHRGNEYILIFLYLLLY